jgi:flagellar L-ring protein FlgH
MKQTNQPIQTVSASYAKLLLTGTLFCAILTTQAIQLPVAQAESLFRASTQYSAQEPIRPRSLFTPPIAREVGDLVTIQIDELAVLETTAELKIKRTQVIEENGSSLFNNMLGFMLGKLPFNTNKIQDTLSSPSFNGLDNSNDLGSKAESRRNTVVRDFITCQVVQVLPNGDLVVQGQKTVQGNKERANLMVTGIVKPYYLDRNNQIASSRVGNFQLIQAGKGVVSRQQNDGIANKIYQFFN